MRSPPATKWCRTRGGMSAVRARGSAPDAHRTEKGASTPTATHATAPECGPSRRDGPAYRARPGQSHTAAGASVPRRVRESAGIGASSRLHGVGTFLEDTVRSFTRKIGTALFVAVGLLNLAPGLVALLPSRLDTYGVVAADATSTLLLRHRAVMLALLGAALLAAAV